jgi:PST family polysaccharide transporter
VNEPESGRDPSLTHRTIGAGLWVLSGTGVQAALRLAVVSVMARLLGPPEFGLAAAAMVVIAFCQILLKSGIRPALVQRANLERRHVVTGFWLSILMGLGLAAGIGLCAGPLARHVFLIPELEPVLQVVAVLLPLQSVSTVAQSLLERELRFGVLVRMEVGSYLVGYAAIGIALAYTGFGVWALVAAYVGQELIFALVSLYVHPHPKVLAWDRDAAGELSRFGIGYAAAAFGNVAAIQGDAWVVGRWLGRESLGFYRYAYELTASVAGLLGQVLQQVMFPAMALVQGDPQRLTAAYRRGVGLISLLVLPATAALYVLAPELIRVILGPQWDAAVMPFRVLALALLVRTTYRVSDALARATGAVYRRAWRHWVHAAAVVGCAWVGQHAGLTGLTIGVAVGMTVNFLLMAQLAIQLTQLRWRDVAVSHLGALPSLLASWIVVGAVAEAARRLDLPAILVVALSLSALLPAIWIGVRWLPRWFLGPDGRDAIGMLLGYVDQRFPAALEHRWVRRLLPFPADSTEVGR